jgi:hypothetical protein
MKTHSNVELASESAALAELSRDLIPIDQLIHRLAMLGVCLEREYLDINIKKLNAGEYPAFHGPKLFKSPSL